MVAWRLRYNNRSYGIVLRTIRYSRNTERGPSGLSILCSFSELRTCVRGFPKIRDVIHRTQPLTVYYNPKQLRKMLLRVVRVNHYVYFAYSLR
jgi:hypothetical protein